MGLAAAKHLDARTTRALALWLLGRAHAQAGQHGEALDHLQQALALAEHTQDCHLQGDIHNSLSWNWEQCGATSRRWSTPPTPCASTKPSTTRC
ncbi:tetratricopeptide repeat protein [Actinophytocola sp.]|uniref:tetratricopeptide repeat protein n=1 Tax=Actinophytocola sp. TaxID=1872138 RepID=UPI0039C8667B